MIRNTNIHFGPDQILRDKVSGIRTSSTSLHARDKHFAQEVLLLIIVGVVAS